MDKQAIKKIFSLFDSIVDYEHPKTFQEELNRQCGFIIVPTCLFCALSWMPYIRLDRNLFPGLPAITWIRAILTLFALIVLSLHFTPSFKKRNYLLLFSLTCYFEIAMAFIIGLVGAHPSYFGGYAMLVMIVPIMPFKKSHGAILLGSTVIVFLVTGIFNHMSFKYVQDIYGLFNMAAALSVSLVAVIVLDSMRRVSFEKDQTIQNTNKQLKESTLEIFQINEELKKANNLKGKLLEIAAHDLKNPLQVIIGYTDLLQEKLRHNRIARERLDIIYNSSDNMIQLLSKLLKALTIDSGKLIVHKRDIDILRIAEAVVKTNRQAAEKKGQVIHFETNIEDSCIVDGDKKLIEEIFDNLLNNAVKFSPPRKSIWVNLDVDKKKGYVIYRVRDEGPGMSESDKAKVFNRFQKLSARPTGGESSSGLGLAIVKDLVQFHQGIIRLSSEPGEGCTFYVKFPLKKIEQENQDEKKASIPMSGKK